MKKYILSILTAFAIATPSLTADDGSKATDTIHINKTAAYDYATHEGIITLESFIPGEMTVVQESIPADIVMVLDWSTSMFDKSRITNLTNAATKFVDSLAAVSTATADHRVSIVTFATGATMRTDFLSMSNASNVKAVKDTIKAYGGKSGTNIKEGGSTQWHLAMCLAYNVMRGGTVLTRFYGWKHIQGQSTSVDYGVKYDSRQESQDNSHNVNFNNNDFTQNYVCSKENSSVNIDDWAKSIYDAKKDRDKDGKYEDKRGNRVDVLSGKRENAKGFVIFFTDGEPTGVKSGQTPTSGTKDAKDWTNAYNSLSPKPQYIIANIAINYAYKLKNELGVTVYSIKLGKLSNSTMNTFANDALTNISSKYPKAERYGSSDRGAAASGTATYFQTIEDGSATLDIAFSQIAKEIKTEVGTKYDTKTIMKDFINNAYFKLPEGITQDNVYSKVFVYENPLMAFDSTATDITKRYKFSENRRQLDHEHDSITIKLTLAKDDPTKNDRIEVLGYNYAKNWCGWDANEKKARGNRLVIEIPFVFKGGEDVSGDLPTNTENSGVYPVKKDDEGKVIVDPTTGEPQYDEPKPYPVPIIKFSKVTIERANLDPGESAIYSVYMRDTTKAGSDSTFVCRISINGERNMDNVSRTIYGLQGGPGIFYTVTETKWNWAYTKNQTSIRKEVNQTETAVIFHFSGKHRDGADEDDPAGLHNHDEVYVINQFDLSKLPFIPFTPQESIEIPYEY